GLDACKEEYRRAGQSFGCVPDERRDFAPAHRLSQPAFAQVGLATACEFDAPPPSCYRHTALVPPGVQARFASATGWRSSTSRRRCSFSSTAYTISTSVPATG